MRKWRAVARREVEQKVFTRDSLRYSFGHINGLGTNASEWGLSRMLCALIRAGSDPALAWCVALSAGKLTDRADPVEGVLSRSSAIDRNELGYKWPFDAGTGTIA